MGDSEQVISCGLPSQVLGRQTLRQSRLDARTFMQFPFLPDVQNVAGFIKTPALVFGIGRNRSMREIRF